MAVGAVGFVVHTAAVTFLMADHHLDSDRRLGAGIRTCVSVTWLLNRTFVFGGGGSPDARTPVEYARYLLVQVGGAVLSLRSSARFCP